MTPIHVDFRLVTTTLYCDVLSLGVGRHTPMASIAWRRFRVHFPERAPGWMHVLGEPRWNQHPMLHYVAKCEEPAP